jgi:hydroxymethylpyrimidine pyrophosphatase-like HAD family hydrolase
VLDVPDTSPSPTATRLVVSFDIDGTMFFGDPAGPVTLELVRQVVDAGHLVGSASDRTRAEQSRLWERHGVEVAFVGGKHHLVEVRDRFAAHRYVHIGDTVVDEHFALAAGFEFFSVERLPEPGTPGWIL